MKRYYRNRIILGAMLSFFILFLLTAAGMCLFSYRQMERETGSFLNATQQTGGAGKGFSQSVPPPMFGYTPDQRRYPSGFYDIQLKADGTIESIQRFGIAEEADISVQQYVQQAVKDRASSGKAGSYKYSITYREDGSARLIMLDISIQLQSLYNTLKNALLAGAVMMALLFVILLPVSSRMAEVFVRNNEKQKQFITDAGHDLKTPVAIIRSNLDVLELQGKSKWSENIRSQTERLERLVSQLVMMTRLEETAEKKLTAVFNFSALLQEQWAAYSTVFEQKHFAVQAEIADSMQLRGHEDSLRKMMSLLLDNVCQYANEGGDVSLSAKPVKNRIRLSLRNTAENLPTQEPSVLTERFTRGDTARNQKNGGSGIGLAAVKRIVEIHRGRLEIRYEGEDTFCVNIDFPAA